MSPAIRPPDAKVVLVTGASSGIGRATADLLHRTAWTVVGASRRGAAGGGWKALAMDVDLDDSVEEGITSVLEDHGRLDAVVANAGWGLAGAVEDTIIDEARAQMETNFFGVARTVRAALPHLRATGGRAVLVGSLGGVIALPFQAFYSASKFAVEGYAEALAREVEPFGVAVTVVEPGNVRTGFTDARRLARPGPGDPYGAARERALRLMERGERKGVRPEKVALTIGRVLAARRPPRRVSVGKIGERVGIPARWLLPYRLFERASRPSLGA